MSRLREETPAAILHAGDIGAAAVIEQLSEVAPTFAVRGNVDDHTFPDTQRFALRFGEGEELVVLLTHVAVRGPRISGPARELAHRHEAELIVCGHSHVPLIAREGDLAVFNPGSAGPRRFALPITYGLLTLDAGTWRARHIDLTTGKTWLPPAPG